MTQTTYQYPDAEGRVLFKVVRTDNTDGTKKFTQWRRASVDAEWEAKSPEGLRPMFGLDELMWAEPDTAILIVEGEKACLAARKLFPSLVVMTWAGGAAAVKRTEWSPLQGRRVAIMPDLDQLKHPADHAQAGTVMPFMMQPGTKAALLVATLTGGALIDAPDAFIQAASWVVPSGWDLADAIPDGFSLSDIKRWIHAALERAAGSLQRTAEVGVPAEALNGEVLPAENTNGVHLEDVPEAVQNSSIELRMETTQNGVVKPIFVNALRLLRFYNSDKFKLRFNLFSNRPYYRDQPLEDEHILRIADSVQTLGVHASNNVIKDAVIAASMEHAFHPVLDYLDGLKWDGIERLEMWLIDHAGVSNTQLHHSMSLKWLVQAIARIRDPGCQADAMLILEGEQGLKKSTLLRVLFGDDWFTDHLPDLSQKDALLQLLGVWCIEVAEFATLGRADANKIKQFLTSRIDRYRTPYGTVPKDFPRACVFAGTVNPGAVGYLKDPTGGRRFWPMMCHGMIDTDAVAAIRDQIWAEADARYKAGETWWLEDDDMKIVVAEAQEFRREDDVWEERVAKYIRSRPRVSVGEILQHAVGINNAGDWTPADQMRVGRILTAFKWMRKQNHAAARKRGEPAYYYINPEPIEQGVIEYDQE